MSEQEQIHSPFDNSETNERRRDITEHQEQHVGHTQEDLDLEDTIGNVFDGFDFEGIRHLQQEESKHDIEDVFSGKHNDTVIEQHERNEFSETHNHIDLDDAIGNALNDVFGAQSQTPRRISEDHEISTDASTNDLIHEAEPEEVQAGQTLHAQPETEHTDEMELDDVIGAAFSNVFAKSHESKSEQSKTETVTEDNEHKTQEPEDHTELDDVIGDAFSNIFNKEQQDRNVVTKASKLESTNQESVECIETKDTEQGQEQRAAETEIKQSTHDSNVEAAFDKIFEKETYSQHVQKDDDNKTEQSNEIHDLDAAIGDAFGEVLGKDKESSSEVTPTQEQKEDATEKQIDQEDSLNAAIGDAFGNVLGRDKVSEISKEEQNQHVIEKEATQEDNLSTQAEDQTTNLTQDHSHQKDDLEDAIGDAFNNIFNQGSEKIQRIEAAEPKEVISEVEPGKPEPTDIQKDRIPTQENEHEEDNLEDAIGDAFANVFAQSKETNKEKPKETESVLHQEESSDKKTQEIVEPTKELPKEQPSQSSETRENDELELENAIGDAFKKIIPTTSTETKQDTELEDAIGDAFSNIFQKDNKEQPTQEKKSDDHMDLDSAIGDAFKSILPSTKPDTAPQDDDLTSAIGDAFKSISNQEKPKTDEVNDDDLNEMISASFKQILGSDKSAPSTGDAPIPDTDMKDVITEAFKSAMSTTTKSKKSEKSKPSKKDKSNLVQNIVDQIDSKNSKLSESAIHNLAVQISHQVQDHLKDDKPNIPLVFGLPQLDESVLEHFQNEAYAENKQGEASNPKFQTAINNALKNVMEGSSKDEGVADLESLQMNDILANAFNMALEKPQELISDLEIDDTGVLVPPPVQTQAPVVQKVIPKPKGKPKRKDAKVVVPGTIAKPIIVPDIPVRRSIINDVTKLPGEVDERSDEAKTKKSPKKSKEPEEGKKLSIAESLALSRTILNQPRRDYSSIESIEQILRPDRTPIPSSSSMLPTVNTPLSNVLSSLTSKINQGGMSDRNIMSVIRSMTETLSAGGSLNLSQYLRPPTAEEIISRYRDQDKKGMVSMLDVARKYLVSTTDGENENEKAVSLIDKVIEQFNVGQRNAEDDLLGNQSEFISSISNSVINRIISSSPESKFTKATISKISKLKENTPEFDQKIRIDNRERKKKWREENGERNKDNDLRVRVIKKATSIFGESDSPEKTAYIEETFKLRREKRIARSKKEDSAEGDDDDERIMNIKTKDAFVVSRDPELVKPVSDLYNIFKAFSNNDGSLAMLVATGASVASAASLYFQNNDTTFKSIDSAISAILTYLLSSKSTSIDSGFTNAVIDRSSLVGSLSNLNLQKRESTGLISGDLKRLKSDVQTSLPGPTPFWGSTSLKMPNYKNKPTSTEPQQSVLKLPRDSPFISNKVHSGVRTDTSSGSPGLRKPGSFQKPTIVNRDDKSRTTNLGFPRLYSASYS
ncbi:hypothetical protein JA1_001095 [Spathaspora sp. JA1]|nr:hypothetical protein JA1_001095 [Spathaspora sp. JA1]